MKKILISLLLIANFSYGAVVTSTPPGSIIIMATINCPQGYLKPDGSAVSRNTYSALFSALGTLYGAGDGSTTFNLPDYRGQFLRGVMGLTTVTGSGSVSSNNATFTSHQFNRTGMRVRLASGTLTGLSASTDYYAIVVDANTLAFATSKANALAGTKIAISGTNSGIIQQYEDPDNQTRVLQSGVSSFSVGSMQEDALQGHGHTVNGAYNAANGSLGGFSNYSGSNSGASTVYTGGAGVTDGTNGTPRTSSESRSRNIYVTYCIKY